MVKCSECGFLALRKWGNSQLVEAIKDYRESGQKPLPIYYRDVDSCPICFVMAYDLVSEVEESAKQRLPNESGDWSGYNKIVIQKDRECPPDNKSFGFTEYQQGFTPKEHREMLDRKAMLEWQAAREREDKGFRERERISNKRYRIIELVLVVITIIVVIVAAFIERGGQPTINIITPNPSGVTIEQQP